MPGTLALKAHAKVNLHLGIHPGRDERGYHRADSIMIPLELADDVTVSTSEAPSVSFSPALSIDVEKSVVSKAVRAIAETFAPAQSYRVEVTRIMPGSGGLGSSSSDAASALLGMAQLAGVAPDDERLVRIAQSIGADVAFFLQSDPALYVGAGDVKARTFARLQMPIALVRPEAGVSTPKAYAQFDEDPIEPRAFDGMVDALLRSDTAAVAACLYNNLAPAACVLAPEIGECLAWLSSQEGVLAAQVTGSGSCSFAICASDEDAARIAAASPWWACATRTVA